MPPYCRGSKHQKNGLAPLEERKRLCDPPNLPNLISVICLFPINMQPLALFLRKEPGGLSSISAFPSGRLGTADKPRNLESESDFSPSDLPLHGARGEKSLPFQPFVNNPNPSLSGRLRPIGIIVDISCTGVFPFRPPPGAGW